jgi:hypothetical protein
VIGRVAARGAAFSAVRGQPALQFAGMLAHKVKLSPPAATSICSSLLRTLPVWYSSCQAKPRGTDAWRRRDQRLRPKLNVHDIVRGHHARRRWVGFSSLRMLCEGRIC